jgi:Lrp/AsnC family transcriptional regulator for asnA, asnC and gidA
MNPEKKLSVAQAKILRALLIDGRKSALEIAQEIGISKVTVYKNYLEMKKEGIIEGATIHFNYRGFGYFAVANLLINVDPNQADQIVAYLRTMQDIYAVFNVGPKGNIRVVATLKTLKQLDEIKDALKQRFSIQSLRSVIWTDVKEMHENLRLAPDEELMEKREDGATTKQLMKDSPKTKVKIDEVDLKIIDILSANGRTPFSKIAEKVGISSNTAKKRYKKLTKSRMIKVTAQIDPAKIGYNAMALFYVTFTLQTDSLSTIEKISQIPDVISIMKTSGDYDLQVYAMVRDIKHLLAIQDQFAEIQGIAKIDMDITEVLHKWPTPRQYISTF